jgi:hypothetical protein
MQDWVAFTKGTVPFSNGHYKDMAVDAFVKCVRNINTYTLTCTCCEASLAGRAGKGLRFHQIQFQDVKNIRT